MCSAPFMQHFAGEYTINLIVCAGNGDQKRELAPFYNLRFLRGTVNIFVYGNKLQILN